MENMVAHMQIVEITGWDGAMAGMGILAGLTSGHRNCGDITSDNLIWWIAPHMR